MSQRELELIYYKDNIILYTNYLYIKGSTNNKYKEKVNNSNNLEIKKKYNKKNNNYKIDK